MDLSILVPTFSRPQEAVANINRLIEWSALPTRKIEIELILSQNAPKNTDLINTESIKPVESPSPDKKVVFLNFIQPARLSPGEHFKNMFYKSTGNWVTWIGDDDLLATDYLNFIESVIVDNKEGINAIESTYEDITRVIFFEKLQSEKIDNTAVNLWQQRKVTPFLYGFNAALRGQQMSGLAFRREIVSECYEHLPVANLYPFICFMRHSQKNGIIARILESRIFVTGDTTKTFSFGSTALIPDISEALRSAPGQSWLTKQKLGIIIFYWPFIMGMLDYSCRNVFDLPIFIKALWKDRRITKLQLLLGMPGIIFFGLRLGIKKRDKPKRHFS